MSLFDLTGKVAVVTGSTRGIGEAIVHRLAEHGAKVVVSSRKADACDKVAAAINAKHPGHAIALPCNISDKAALQALVDAANAHWGKIDVLICNAAVNPYFGPSKDLPDDALDKIMASNVKSNHWLAHMVLPQMVERRDGSIIVISSIGGIRGSAVLGAYCLSKAADFQLARNLAVEYGPHNVRINCIARIGEPDEIAGAAVFLASPAGAFMTGQQIVIDGGTTIA
jgi:NAD(P)-dependent dehydrogenase (short-subunit alcohol dehydrogenase family)